MGDSGLRTGTTGLGQGFIGGPCSGNGRHYTAWCAQLPWPHPIYLDVDLQLSSNNTPSTIQEHV